MENIFEDSNSGIGMFVVRQVKNHKELQEQQFPCRVKSEGKGEKKKDW